MGGTDTGDGARRRSTQTSAAAHGRKPLGSAIDKQRANFLRLCRMRLDPGKLGLPQSRRKRTVGVRREEVAALSGVSVSWYAWLEQGRDMRVSDDVLERVSHTLRLSEEERIYLFSLVQHRDPRIRCGGSADASPAIVRMINGMAVPAIALNLRWDVLAWNALHSLLYRDYGAVPASARNHLESLFAVLEGNMSPLELENTARRLVARLRFDYSKIDNDPAFEALLRRLTATSPLFRRLWRNPEFSLRAYGPHRFRHPLYGELAFEHTSYVPDGFPDIRIVICTPESASAKQAVARSRADLMEHVT